MFQTNIKKMGSKDKLCGRMRCRFLDDGFISVHQLFIPFLIWPCCQQAPPATLLTLQQQLKATLLGPLCTVSRRQTETDTDITCFYSPNQLQFQLYISNVNHKEQIELCKGCLQMILCISHPIDFNGLSLK